MAAPTHDRFAVALFAEELEDCEHSAPSSDYAILYPRTPDFVLVLAEGNLPRSS
jgi:hypothetical protein